MTACFENALFAYGACQIMLDGAKKMKHRLKMKVARQKGPLQTLQSEHDEVSL